MENIALQYLEAMCRRDMHPIASSLCEASTVVMLNGQIYKGIDAILNMHREWFADMDWRMSYATEAIHESENVCHALVKVDYHDQNEEGQPYQIQYLLFLLFGKESGKWVLLHDQNTLIR